MYNIIIIMEEEWKLAIENEDYWISNLGNVKRKNKTGLRINNRDGETIIGGSVMNRGYRYFQISRGGKRNNYLFHHLVAQHFLGDKPNIVGKIDIDHIDRNKLNNRVDNLRWCSHSDNMKNTDRYRTDITETDPRLRANILQTLRDRAKRLSEGKPQRKKRVEIILIPSLIT